MLSAVRRPARGGRAVRPSASSLRGLILQASSDDAPAHRRVDPAIDRRVGDRGQVRQILERMKVLAVSVAIDDQVIDGGVGRQAGEPGLELGDGRPLR